MAAFAEDDLYLPLAFGLHATRGAYAVLAGAGVSRGAGLPTAWDIELDLLRQVQSVLGNTAELTGENAEEWYRERFQTDLTYSGLLEQVAPASAHARQAVLNRFFEAADGEEPVRPSLAHRSVARLVKLGAVRVIVTMNFDHLFEDALRELDIEPVVVSTASAAAGLRPLHTIDHLVVHLHGDYRDSDSVRNTDRELSEYEPATRELLEQILRNYGLLVAGWSVRHDHALRDAVNAYAGRHFTTGWIEPGALNDAARELVANKGAVLVSATADEAFGKLADQVAALDAREQRHPITAAVAARTIKRDLGGEDPAIRAHDLAATAFAELQEVVDEVTDAARGLEIGALLSLANRIEAASLVPSAVVATLAYWGDSDTDKWWLPELDTYAFPMPFDRGITLQDILELPMHAGVQIFYAAGIAATAAERWDLVAALLSRAPTRPGPRIHAHDGTLGTRLDWHVRYLSVSERGFRPRPVAPLLTEALGLSARRVGDAFEEFEALRVATIIQIAEDFRDVSSEYARAAYVAAEDRDQLDAAQKRRDEGTAATIRGNLREHLQEQSRALSRLIAPAAGIRRPHLEVVYTTVDGEDRWLNAAVDRLAVRLPQLGALLSGEGVRGNYGLSAGRVALHAAEAAIHRIGVDLALRSGTAASRMWLDQNTDGT